MHFQNRRKNQFNNIIFFLLDCRDGDAVELELNSRVISISAVRGSTGAVIEADGGTENGTGFVEVELELARRPNTGAGGKQWNSTCAATRGTSWNLESSCYLMEPASSSENVTRCRCLGTGTFAALLTMNAPTVSITLCNYLFE